MRFSMSGKRLTCQGSKLGFAPHNLVAADADPLLHDGMVVRGTLAGEAGKLADLSPDRDYFIVRSALPADHTDRHGFGASYARVPISISSPSSSSS